jgi:hypothetical protein
MPLELGGAETKRSEKLANMTALTFLAIWILISIPFGILVGRCRLFLALTIDSKLTH